MGRIAFWQTHRPWMTAALLSVLVHSAILLLVNSRPMAANQGLRSRPLYVNLRIVKPTAALPAPPAPQAPTMPAPASTTSHPPAEALTAPAPMPMPTPLPQDLAPSLDSYYFTPDELTSKPVFLRDKGPTGPTFIPDVLPLPVMAWVYIDEQGEVVQVALSDNFLSETARKFIVDSFLNTAFTPGMLGSLAVKSLLTIEVKLDPALPAR